MGHRLAYSNGHLCLYRRSDCSHGLHCLVVLVFPQIEGEMLGLFDMKPYRTLASKMIGGVLTGFAGFSVGREGPAVQIGGSAGKIVSYWMNSGLREQRILTSAGAGLA